MIKVDENKCIGCGACVAIDSEHFAFNDQGLSSVINQEITDSVKEAKDACPVDAITIENTGNETTEVVNQEANKDVTDASSETTETVVEETTNASSEATEEENN